MLSFKCVFNFQFHKVLLTVLNAKKVALEVPKMAFKYREMAPLVKENCRMTKIFEAFMFSLSEANTA